MKSIITLSQRVLGIVLFTSLITFCTAQEEYGISVDARWPYGPSFTLEKSGDLAIIGDGAMLMIYDVSDVGNPQLKSSIELLGAPEDMELAENILYIALEKFGLYIYDITDPTNPEFLGLHTNTRFYPRILIDGNIGYFTYSSGIEVLDLSIKADPEVLYTMDLEYYPRSLTKSGEHLFVATYDKLIILDVSDPTNPEIGAQLTGFVYPEDIIVDGEVAFLGISDTVYVIDISDPNHPEIIYKEGDKYAFNQLAYSNGFLYCSGASARVYVYEWKDNMLTYKVNKSFGGFCQEMSIENDTLYATNVHKGLDIINVSDINNIELISRIENHTYTFDIKTDGDFLYVGSYEDGLTIFDNSISGEFTQIANLPVGDVRSIKLVGSYAYLAKYGYDFGVADISDPENPIEIGTLEMDDYTWDLEIDGNKAYIAQGRAGFYIADISDPANPTVMGTVDTEGQVVNVEIMGEYVLAADFMEGFKVIDVSDPTDPTIVGVYNDDYPNDIYVGNVFDVEVDGNIAFIPDHSYGFQIVDLSDVTNPQKIHQEWTGGRPYDIELDGNFMYLALSYGGLKIYDISNLTNPEEVAFIKTGGELEKITLYEGKIFGADYECGFVVMRAWATTSDRLQSKGAFEMKVIPNPADSKSVLEINAQQHTIANLSIVSMDGRILNKVNFPSLEKGQNNVPLADIMHHAPYTGLYYLVLRTKDGIKSIAIVWDAFQ